jgi:hypothetical protein
MSSNDKPIRVIKRESRDFPSEDEAERTPLMTEPQVRRQMLQKITSWIEEQRETKKAFYRRRLF